MTVPNQVARVATSALRVIIAPKMLDAHMGQYAQKRTAQGGLCAQAGHIVPTEARTQTEIAHTDRIAQTHLFALTVSHVRVAQNALKGPDVLMDLRT